MSGATSDARGDGVVILRLGSGGTARRGCGPKAALLDQAARSGLPVPPGVIVLDEAWRSALARGLVRLEGSGARKPISVPDPSLLVHLIGLPAFTGPLAIRAAFSSEEGRGETVAGRLVPGLFVEGRRAAALAAGLAGVWASAYGRPRDLRRDLIAHEMVRARAEGVAFLQHGYEDDVVEAADGVARGLAARPAVRVARSLPRVRRGEKPTEDDPVAARLQVLLLDVRRAFGDGDWMVEWADDGEHIWLVQLGALSALPPRNEAFTAASHRDILPDLPSNLMASLIGSCAAGLFQHYRRLDPGLPTNRPLLEIFHGRPLLNLTLLTDMVRRWGLPTHLSPGPSAAPPTADFGARPRRMIRHAPVLARLLEVQARAVRSARAAAQAIVERTASSPAGLTETLDELCWLYGVARPGDAPLTSASSVPLALLRRAGVLGDLARGWRLTATEMREGLEALSSGSTAAPRSWPRCGAASSRRTRTFGKRSGPGSSDSATVGCTRATSPARATARRRSWSCAAWPPRGPHPPLRRHPRCARGSSARWPGRRNVCSGPGRACARRPWWASSACDAGSSTGPGPSSTTGCSPASSPCSISTSTRCAVSTRASVPMPPSGARDGSGSGPSAGHTSPMWFTARTSSTHPPNPPGRGGDSRASG